MFKDVLKLVLTEPRPYIFRLTASRHLKFTRPYQPRYWSLTY